MRATGGAEVGTPWAPDSSVAPRARVSIGGRSEWERWLSLSGVGPSGVVGNPLGVGTPGYLSGSKASGACVDYLFGPPWPWPALKMNNNFYGASDGYQRPLWCEQKTLTEVHPATPNPSIPSPIVTPSPFPTYQAPMVQAGASLPAGPGATQHREACCVRERTLSSHSSEDAAVWHPQTNESPRSLEFRRLGYRKVECRRDHPQPQ